MSLIVRKNKVNINNSINGISSDYGIYIGRHSNSWGSRMKKFDEVLLFIWSGNNCIAYASGLQELSLEEEVLSYTGFSVIIIIINFLFLIIIIIYLLK